VAQLGARFHGMEEVVGSNPTRSTILHSVSPGSSYHDVPYLCQLKAAVAREGTIASSTMLLAAQAQNA
jgi:hypothetical protein